MIVKLALETFVLISMLVLVFVFDIYDLIVHIYFCDAGSLLSSKLFLTNPKKILWGTNCRRKQRYPLTAIATEMAAIPQ